LLLFLYFIFTVVRLWLNGCQLTGSIPSKLGWLESVGTHTWIICH
jgi:hypothetical protein